MNLAVSEDKTHLQWTRLYSSCGGPPTLLARGAGVRAGSESRRRACPGARRAAACGCVGREKSRKNVCEERFAHLDRPIVPSTARVGGDEQHMLVPAVLGGEPLEQRVGVRREAHRERPELLVVPGAVEDDDAAHALRGDEAREGVAELAPASRARRRGGGCSRRRGRASARPSSALRCRASNRRTAAATLTFSDSTAPECGIETSASQRAAHERPEALALGAEHDRDAAGEVGVPHRRARRRRRRRPRVGPLTSSR